VFEDKGVIKVQPDVVKTLFEHFVKYTLRLLLEDTLSAKYQKLSGKIIADSIKNNFKGLKEKVE